jgi:alpha-galactosidase
MQELCDDAWLLNLTNPMTALCRAVTRATNVQCVGLCHEIMGAHFALSNLLDADFASISYDVVGVNHLPFFTALRVDGTDAFPKLRELLHDEQLQAQPISLPPGLDPELVGLAAEVTKGSVIDQHRVKFALFDRFGVLPAAGDRHLVEFFPGFLTEESGWGKRWGVALTTIADRERDASGHRDALARLRAAAEVPNMPSGEMVAPIIDSMLRDKTRALPLNLPNAGQALDLPHDVVVEAMCIADADGLRGRDELTAPPAIAEWLRRIVSSQEATVDAGLTGRRDRVVEAMLLDPLAGRIDFDHVEQMTEEMLAATKQWLPQFV